MAVPEILQELAAALDDVLGVDALGQQAFSISYLVNRDPAVPAIDMYPGNPSFRSNEEAAFRDLGGAYNFTVRARITGDDDGSQLLMLRLMDDEDDLCVAAALMADQTLNGWASSVYVEGPTGYTSYPAQGGAQEHLGCQWAVKVLRGST